MTGIYIEVDDAVVLDGLNRLAKTLNDPSPVLKNIGEYLLLATRGRFDSSTAPDGSTWAPNSRVVYDALVESKGKKVLDRKGVSPAHAGIDPGRGSPHCRTSRLPRARGE